MTTVVGGGGVAGGAFLGPKPLLIQRTPGELLQFSVTKGNLFRESISLETFVTKRIISLETIQICVTNLIGNM